MNRNRMLLKIVTVLSACLLSITFATSLRSESTKPQKVSKKEFRWLIQNAKTAADHQKLAAYYTAQAEHLMKESKKHQEYAEIYANRPLWGKSGIPDGLVAHCRQLAVLEAKAANEAQQMADIHEEMAKESPN